MKNKKSRVWGKHDDNPIQQARIRAGLTQQEAAEALECNLRTLQRYEEGKCKKGPPGELLLKMRTCYSCEIGDLIPGTTPSQKSPGELPPESV